MSFLGRWRSRLPALLAFSLLLAQISLPWTVSWFATEDGPSHLYGAIVASNLLLHHRHTHFASVYQFNRRIVPNWTATIVLAAIELVTGVDQAEKLMVSLCLCFGFFAFAYAVRCFAPHASPWTPLANFLIQTWFLYIGFYNFYLGMLLALVVIGQYARWEAVLTVRRTVLLTVGLLAVYFTQLIGVAFALVGVGSVALWMHGVVPKAVRSGAPVQWRQMGGAALTMAPVLLLTLLFAWSSPPGHAPSDWRAALVSFPQHVFATAAGRMGGQAFLWPAILLYIGAGVVLMTRLEWVSPRGGLVLAMAAMFALYLIVPDEGMGGSIVKIRFAWGVFLAGGLLAASVSRMRFVHIPLAVGITALLATNLAVTSATLSDSSDLIEDYLASAGQLPRGARMIRLRYATPDLPARYGIEEIGRDPIFHLDALVAARCRCIDLTDYEAPNEIFPVAFNPNVDRGLRSSLWGMEGPGQDASEQVRWLRTTLPVPIDYVLVVSDSSSPKVGQDKLLANLTSGMRMISRRKKDSFVDVYQRTAER